ncbi:hypothetical protein [Mycoplasmopsis fermentans]|uniref:Uncharacterized protein n=2 Tax=Mycoplasmopsis fermentans TaxID=2115 RepID=C4XFQ4_MYCFP|nr:hypothetical protein [Mycoplasmopsis fermentans]VEU66974.1 Uncharacterised protein [Mesomycoplasma conjunctivae]ADN69404.1 hypothetical membrane spanning protein [Mycoplasmopsis fermentans JER]ADV35028.1 Hypothetical Protein MfeM64YM_1033 [Mycoplasmopsis fermentans M64]VEU60017.1 Uncharacterised protein [Mycoplasmopsis fermentans]BAH69976.1 hypothetical protein MBIO_0711 [Mycoplasmopsis fermentans PG18]
MKLSTLLNTINVTNITPSVIVASNENLNSEQQKILELFSRFTNDEIEIFNYISNDIINNKNSTKKVINSIDEIKLDKIYDLFISKISQSSIKNKDELLNKLRDKREIFKTELIKKIKEQSLTFKKSEKKSKIEINSMIKRVNSSFENKDWKINDDGTISSKFILKDYELLNNHLINLNDSIKKTIDHIAFLQKWKIACVSLSAISAASATGLWIASFFCPPCAIAASVASASASLLSIAAITLSDRIYYLNETLKNSQKFIELFQSSNYSIPIWGMVSSIPMALNRVARVYEMLKLSQAAPSIATMATGVVGSALQTLGSFYDVYTASKELDYFNECAKKASDLISDFSKKIKDIKKIGWVVIHESEQTGPYYMGGTGGKNLIFKNLETNEIKTINEMLELSDFELSLWSLQRVNDPKKGTYLRKKANNSLYDNLG